MNTYTLAVIKHASTVIKGIKSHSLDPQLTQILLAGSGEADTGFAAIGEIKPQMTFTTSAIQTALGNLGGINGIAITSNLFAWFQKTLSGGIRSTGATHIMLTGISGILVPQTLRIPHAQQAEIDYLAALISADGSASPITVAPTTALDAGQLPASEGWTLGGASLNGLALPGVSLVTVNFGIVLEITAADGHVYAIHVCIKERRPSITITTYDIEAFQSWGAAGSNWLEGVPQGASDSVITISDMVEGGGRGSSPITLTIDEGMMFFNSIGGDGNNERFVGQVTLTPTYDGVADIIAIAGL
jgi:hypothetical protein